MTKKDYELIARILHRNVTSTDPKMTEVKYTGVQISKAMVMQFADVLQKNDPRFDRTKFMLTCGSSAYNGI